ncbi:MAG: hypothetical protein A3G24_12430 [Betaproteobacteria bacterium RIFCSPLOWO2_12_FULL_62_13]|nr:MAG: hypothetical protein A3G24_12430 [Betaproteobacteria bacterium RIFCSPLOWO2_12_FULL_62_13]
MNGAVFTVPLSQAGRPVVVFVYDNFERAARAQAKALGVPDLRIYIYPQYRPGDPSPPEAAKAIKAAADFPQLLLRRQ